ncbi:MAG: RNA polymerase sigma-70 factor [Gemmatimonadaceae bacterium]
MLDRSATEVQSVPHPPGQDEAAWVARIRAGDVAAFEALYRTYWQQLYAFAFRYLRSGEEAEDAVQGVFFRVWRGRTDWHPVGPIGHYLYLAVRNSALDRLERDAVARRWRQGRATELRAMSPSAPEVDAQLESAELDAAVERALAELPPKRRAVCTLRLTDGLSYTQIADRLGIAPKTVETQLARGLKFLRERLVGARS